MSPPEPSRDELLDDPGYLRLKEYLIESTGLAYYIDKDADLVRRIRHRLSELRLQDCASYLELLRDSVHGSLEMDALIAEVTIGETYFFRHQEHFDALRKIMLPEIIARNAAKHSLRIWCAGCADGAEPYSLSILLRREMAHCLAGWNVSILGTDINRRTLAAASGARFDAWDLRSTPDELIGTCFEPSGKQWVLEPGYRSGVSFQFHNLVEDVFPPLLGDPTPFDLILCRNVMIYFEPEQMRRTVQRFYDCLAPGGWLLVGPSEPNMTHFLSFRAVNAPGVTLYQRPADALSGFAPPFGFAAPVFQAPLFDAPESQPEKLPVTAAAAPLLTLADLRQRADQGDWENAARLGRQLVESDNLNPLTHFHYALILEHMGEYAESERSLRRAIYLDRRAALAHYHLGLLLRSRGDWRHAERCFSNALNLLSSLPGDTAIAGADEITAAELSRLCRMQIGRTHPESTQVHA